MFSMLLSRQLAWLCPHVTTHSQPCRYCPLWTQRALTALKRVYLVKRSLYIYSAKNILPYPMWDITNTPPCRHNVLVVSHGIVGLNKQTPLTEPNKPPHRGWGLALIPFVTTHSQPCRYCPFWTQRALTALKRVYLVKRSLYIYSARNILPYPIWDITPHL